MSIENGAALLPIPTAALFQAFRSGEVLWAEYRGEPLISVFHPQSKSGGAVQLSNVRLEGDFKRWWDAVNRAYLPAEISALQIKFIVCRDDESRIRQLASQYGVVPSAIATFEAMEQLECYFYSESGRLRIAPVQGSTSVPLISSTSERAGMKVRALIVDDSPTIRRLLRRILEGSPVIEVVGEAERPSQVESMIEALQPDVMTLDINMPEMSGVDLLRKILRKRYIPTVMISALSINDGHEVLDALEVGAVDYIHKPSAHEIAALTPIIQEKIIGAARVQKQKAEVQPVVVQKAPQPSVSFEKTPLIAIGASTGGTEAIKKLFLSFPTNIPPIVVVQHIPPYFSTAFANRLNEICKFEVREARDGDEVKPGRALIAPGGLHMEIHRVNGKLLARVFDGQPVNRFKPSVDVLFNSVAKTMSGKCTGILLTGMGSDGAKGLLAMRRVGALTIAQDEASCVVFGMPRAAIDIAAASLVRSIDQIPESLLSQKAA